MLNIEIMGITVTEVKGFGRQKGHAELYRGAEYNVDFLPKIKIELVIDSQRVDEVVETILQNSCTNKIGDGKIFISTIENSIRVRTGESGISSL